MSSQPHTKRTHYAALHLTIHLTFSSSSWVSDTHGSYRADSNRTSEIAALADDFPLGRGSGDEDGGDRSFVPLGGHANSCYVWRTGSALHQIRTR